ncbi:phosphoribosylglycinamide formyltransferase [Brachybacterium sp. JHP9]|uniref:Phosphoribosylglycinamide formyltransferase n=1 Tax=Brachybacterium equifaecis TaxID=2910770 RepID=A0ABT0R046_9MICO|nr:phosphoribosylglycinamide formyltransferase [Brachybacterium equifaecis]
MAPARIIVLISGTGSTLAALIRAAQAPDSAFEIVGVLADGDAPGLAHARQAAIPTAVVPLRDHPTRADWDRALAAAIAELSGRALPDLVVLAGFMKLVGPAVLSAHPGRIINTHPALLPSFPGAHGVRDALAHGVKITGATVIEVDAGIDTGRILAQRAVEVHEGDTEETLHERIKVVEREMLVDVVSSLAAAPAPQPA